MDTCSDESGTYGAAPSLARWPNQRSASLALILGSLSAFGPLAIDMYLPAFPRIAGDLHCPLGAVQVTLSVFLVGLAVGQFLWGTLSDRWGRRLPMLLGCAAFVGAAAVCSMTRSISVLIAARFVMGLGGSAGVVVSRAVVRDLFDEHESARFYSMMMIVGGLAPIVAPALGSLLLAWWGWRSIFIFVAVFAALCLGGIMGSVPETLPRGSRMLGNAAAVLGNYAGLIRNRKFIYYALSVGFGYSGLFAYIASSPFLFMKLFGVSPQRYSLLFMTNAAGIYCAGQSNRWLLRRMSPRQILGRAAVVNLAAGLSLVVVALGGWGGLPVFFGLLFVLIGSLGWIFPNIVAVAMKPVADQAGSASALLGVMQFTFGAASASLIGALAGRTALPATCVIAVSSLCSWLMLVVFAERHAA